MISFAGSDGQAVSVAVNASSWPFTVPQPTIPTGLTVQNGGSYTSGNDREFRNASINATVTSKRVVLRDCNFSYLAVGSPAEDVWVVGGQIGPMGSGFHPAVSSGFQTAVAKRVVFDGVRFTGMHQGTLSDHTEGLQVGGVDVLWIKNCRFDDNHVFDLFMRCWSPAPIRYVLVENSDFYPTDFLGGGANEGTYSIRVAGDGDSTKPTDVTIRNNRIPTGQPISVDNSAVRVTLQNNQPVL